MFYYIHQSEECTVYISTYRYILVHTGTYDNVPVHTCMYTIYLCVLLFMLYNVCLILVGAMAWYKGVHHLLYYSMTFHAIVQLMMYSLVTCHGAH